MLDIIYGLWRTEAWRNRSWRFIAHGAIARPRYAYAGDHQAIVRTCDGHRLFVDTTDLSVSADLIAKGFFDGGVERVIRRELKPGQIAADVGAHVGYFTLVMASILRARGRLHSFEPQPKMFAMLRKSVVLNAYRDRVTTHEFALGALNGKERIVIPRELTGGAHIEWRDDSSRIITDDEYEVHDIQVRTLDKVLAEQGVQALDFMKIDAEGSEAQIIDGMGDLLNHPTLKIVMEWSEPQLRSRGDPQTLLSRLRNANFVIQEIGRDGTCTLRSDEELLRTRRADLLLTRP